MVLQVLSEMIGYPARVADDLKSGRIPNDSLKIGISEVGTRYVLLAGTCTRSLESAVQSWKNSALALLVCVF